MNKNENYIMLGGKKIPLTDEQVKQIQSDVPEKSPFDRSANDDIYYYFDCGFEVERAMDEGDFCDDLYYNSANYCTDENIMKQHALHMKLNNLLWRYSMTHGGDEMEFGPFSTQKYYIAYDAGEKEFYTDWNDSIKCVGAIYFESNKIAEAAIEEIVKPFIAEHPDFDVTKM